MRRKSIKENNIKFIFPTDKECEKYNIGDLIEDEEMCKIIGYVFLSDIQ